MTMMKLNALLYRRDKLKTLLRFYNSEKSGEEIRIRQIVEELGALEYEIFALQARKEVQSEDERVRINEEILRQERIRR